MSLNHYEQTYFHWNANSEQRNSSEVLRSFLLFSRQLFGQRGVPRMNEKNSGPALKAPASTSPIAGHSLSIENVRMYSGKRLVSKR